MQRIILMEGHDLSGKTSLGKTLSKLLKIPYYKGCGPNTVFDSIKDRALCELEQMTQLLKQTKMDIIIDRSYLSELVYSDYFSRLTHRQLLLRCIDTEFKNLNAINVIVYADDESIKERYKKRGDEKVALKDIFGVRDTYFDYTHTISCKHFYVLNTNANDVYKLAKEIAKSLKAEWKA